VFDQERENWFWWNGDDWQPADRKDGPRIMHPHFTGTGTRQLQDPAKRAIEQLFTRSFL
jgi:hypothetical protein